MMNSYLQFLQHFSRFAPGAAGDRLVHAFLTGYASREDQLFATVESLLPQVDFIHVYFNDSGVVPGFLQNEKIFVTRSRDFGYPLGESGKYYWCSDAGGYHLICSDQYVYPGNYSEEMVRRIELYHRKCMLTLRGYRVSQLYQSGEEPFFTVPEVAIPENDLEVSFPEEGIVAYHSTTVKISRHHFYQPELNNLWLALQCRDQQVPIMRIAQPAEWQFTGEQPLPLSGSSEIQKYRNFLIKSCFTDNTTDNEPGFAGTPNQVFDRIYVMNLDRRPDRMARMIRATEKAGINITRFSATDGNSEEIFSRWKRYFSQPLATLPEGIDPLVSFTDKFTRYDHYIARIHFMETKLNRKAVQSPGAFGYAATYARILEEAITLDLDRILILDDDVVFHKQFPEAFATGMRQLPPSWKLIMLGAMQHHWEPWIQHYSENLYRCHGSSVASHATGIHRSLWLPLLFYVQRYDLPVDEGALFHMQHVYDPDCFIFYPNIAIQDMTESDISSSAMDTGETEKWMKLFRWDLSRYDYPCNNPIIEKQALKFSSTKAITDE